ncbi:MAG: hypothetical protein DU429_08020 [Candidatus Tokpelaia sp.]|nr:MAG: hypothetical protein DU429_08020 [Candidatus Tokpelaia sp.]KAA6206076.1 MAG: hypothetical protein DU430_02245 [Candidatus Tokpelaia sp.]
MPFDIDIHSIAANPKKAEPGHFRYDFRYLPALTSELETKAAGARELSFLWQPIAAVKEASLQRLIRKAQLHAII